MEPESAKAGQTDPADGKSEASASGISSAQELEEGELRGNDTESTVQHGVPDTLSQPISDIAESNSGTEAQRESEDHNNQGGGRLTLRVAKKTWMEAMHSGRSPSVDELPNAAEDKASTAREAGWEVVDSQTSINAGESEASVHVDAPEANPDSELQTVRMESEAQAVAFSSVPDQDAGFVSTAMNDTFSAVSSEDEDERGKLMIVDAETNQDDLEQTREDESTGNLHVDETLNNVSSVSDVNAPADPEPEVEPEIEAEPEAEADPEPEAEPEPEPEPEPENDDGETEVTTTSAANRPTSPVSDHDVSEARTAETTSDKPSVDENVRETLPEESDRAREPEVPVLPRVVETVSGSTDDVATVSSTSTENKPVTLRISRSQIFPISASAQSQSGSASVQRSPLPVIVVKTHEKRDKEKVTVVERKQEEYTSADSAIAKESKSDESVAKVTDAHSGVSSSPSTSRRERECRTKKETLKGRAAQSSASPSPSAGALPGNGQGQRKLRSHTAAQNQIAAAAANSGAEREEDCVPPKKKRLRSSRVTQEPPVASAPDESDSTFEYNTSVNTEVKLEQVDNEYASPTGLADLYAVWQKAREVAEMLRYEETRPNEDVNRLRAFVGARRKAWERVRSLVRTQPTAPRGFSDYMMLTGSVSQPVNTAARPSRMLTENAALNELFAKQAAERERLATQQCVERDRLRLSCEQEMLRVHTKAAQRLANQSIPFGVCSVLFLTGNVELAQMSDEAIDVTYYDMTVDPGTELDRENPEESVGQNGLPLNSSSSQQQPSTAANASCGRQTRLAARLAALNATLDELTNQQSANPSQSQSNSLLSAPPNNLGGRHLSEIIAEVIEKFDKTKQSTLFRHRCEAISLRATQRLDLEAKMKRLGLCELNRHPVISDDDVPLVHVVADFPLLPLNAL